MFAQTSRDGPRTETSSGYEGGMELDGPRTLHVSRVVDLPPRTAAAAFDALVPGAAPADFAIRRAYRRLAISRRIRVAVEVELVHRSGGWCEVGVRPCGRSVPVEGGPKRERYFGTAIPMVTGIADSMVVAVDAWMDLALQG